MSSIQSTLTLEVHDDVVELRHTGKFELEFARRATEAVTEARRRHPRVFVINAAGGGTTAEARKFMVEWLRSTPVPLEAAVWGGSTLHRTMVEMILRGVKFFRPNQFTVTFHATRADALAWVAEQRKTPPPWERGS